MTLRAIALDRLNQRLHQRGAVFVEALIIISSFLLFLLGLMYFRTFYVAELGLLRTARASTIAYSMGGCTDNNPSAWARKDLAKTSNVTPKTTSTQQPTTQSRPVTGSAEAQGIVRDLPGTGSDSSVLNPIGSVTLADKVYATITSQQTRRRSSFSQDVDVSSHVTCGDKVRDGDFGEIVGVVTRQFKR